MADWIMVFVLSGLPFAGGPYTKEDCRALAEKHAAQFKSNARCVNKDNPYRRLPAGMAPTDGGKTK
jgi:hypothetical protein